MRRTAGAPSDKLARRWARSCLLAARSSLPLLFDGKFEPLARAAATLREFQFIEEDMRSFTTCTVALAIAVSLTACGSDAPSGVLPDRLACPPSPDLAGCARVPFLLLQPDGTPAQNVYLSSTALDGSEPSLTMASGALPSSTDGRTELRLDWLAGPLPSVAQRRVIAFRLAPNESQVRYLDTMDVVAPTARAGERPMRDSIVWTLKQW